jgi:hypothetical protein
LQQPLPGPAGAGTAGNAAAKSKGVAEVWPKQLTGVAAAALLRAGGPVLLRGTRLSACRLAPLQTASSVEPVATSHSAAPAAGALGAPQEDPLPSLWHAKTPAGAAAGPAAAASGAPWGAPVVASPTRCARFVRCDAAKNLPGSYYEVRAPDAEARALAGFGLREWRERWLAWGAHKLLLEVREGGKMTREGREWAALLCCHVLCHALLGFTVASQPGP